MEERGSWIPVPPGSGFSIRNLPYGSILRNGTPHLVVAIGDRLLDLHALASAGLLEGACDRTLASAPNLNPLLAAGRPVWSALRARLIDLLQTGGDERLRCANTSAFLIDARDARTLLPIQVGDYVDFYSSREHATNFGRLFRPNGDPLLPNWKHMPIGYHGRASTIVVSETAIVRPRGQRKAPHEDMPSFGASERLDIELEVGFVTGPGNELGAPIPIERAHEHIFGLVLVNDWSARDIQAWEYQPLGPFLGKSFATTISPWIVPLEALEPYRVEGPRQEPLPLPYLRAKRPWAFDIELSVNLRSARMRAQGIPALTISHTNFKGMYWSMAQQLAHASVNGTALRPGDLYASGTISGSDPRSYGSLIELTWNGERPLQLPTGERRTFLHDGDEIALRGWCGEGDGRIGFGSAVGTILSAYSSQER
jgi:fumarylacetoacetase